jgi:hypothetical protein
MFYTDSLNFFEDRKLDFIFLSLIKIFIENGANLHTFEFIHSVYIYDETLNSSFQLILKNPKFICNIKPKDLF